MPFGSHHPDSKCFPLAPPRYGFQTNGAARCSTVRISVGSPASDVLGWTLGCSRQACPISSARATQHQISAKSKKRSERKERPYEACLGALERTWQFLGASGNKLKVITKFGPRQWRSIKEESTLEKAVGWMRMKKKDVELSCFWLDSANHQFGGTGMCRPNNGCLFAQVECQVPGALQAAMFSR